MHKHRQKPVAALVTALVTTYAGSAAAFTFESENISGSFDSTVTLGVGIRATSPGCGLVLRDSSGTAPSGQGVPSGGAVGGCTEYTSGLGDQGNLNYRKGDAFTTYLKGSHEFLLKLPDDYKFMTRFTWLKDFSATHTSGIGSVGTPPGLGGGLAQDAREDLGFKARLMDFWVSKEFWMGDQKARLRVGNQVISWGESFFTPGGINQINSMDLMRLSQPGTQLKEVFLPAPIISLATGLGHGVNVEGYVQMGWNDNYFPPTGSYWSTVNGLGKGASAYGLVKTKPKTGNQYGGSVRWQPTGTQLNLGFYAISYQDKSPQFSYNADGVGHAGWMFPEDRKLYGVSANFPLGDWSLGTELSYRPKDAVALNTVSSDFCAGGTGGHCYVDEKKFQWHLTGMLSMTPSDYGGVLSALGGAQTANLILEAVMIRYPNLKPYYSGEAVAAGGWAWGLENNPANGVEAVGTKNSWGFNVDFSWVYDSTLIPGWQVTPEIFYSQTVSGRTPTTAGTFMQGAKSANFILNFAQNPATWQFGVNYARFWGGDRVLDQPLKDRDFYGAYLSRNF